MPQLFLGNFGFEEDLAGQPPTRSVAIARLEAELAVCWLAVARDGDRICLDADVPEAFPAEVERQLGVSVSFVRPDECTADKGIELIPWGWTERVLQWGQRRGYGMDAPPIATVRAVNSRRFSFELERSWGKGLDRAAALTSLREVETFASGMLAKDRWVLKGEFGHAARDRLRVRGSELPGTSRGWIASRLKRDGILFAEPWVESIEEAGLQWTVPRSGPPVLEGVTTLEVDASGQYRGSRISATADPPDVWRDAVDVGRRAALAAQVQGYFGPLGIDAMRYRRADGTVGLRALQDINGRWTMGRLALGWRRLLGPGETGFWQHLRKVSTESPAADAPDGRVLPTSPTLIDGRMVSYFTQLILSRAR
ncbi:hypothetical protein Mal4_19330 [Maioricimonas rarisocia]|uniref:ATP-grasp domain-containing protein n=1 Tax=Maioricimonas rarisocia TaxID=2528026 RepID=A0A517Z557_9PLAN|nr:hypothetical protein [Maioricimonas rarisocia]QDU37618.1 hypothetical protein Mal4_19330 [Maioricimonas rarisocia]